MAKIEFSVVSERGDSNGGRVLPSVAKIRDYCESLPFGEFRSTKIVAKDIGLCRSTVNTAADSLDDVVVMGDYRSGGIMRRGWLFGSTKTVKAYHEQEAA